jgi:hypothetical protein
MHYRVKSTRKRRHYRVKRTRNRNRKRNRNRTRTVNRYRILTGGAVTDEEIKATKKAVNKIFEGFEVKSKERNARRNKDPNTPGSKCLESIIEKNETTCIVFRVYMDPENIFIPGSKLIVIDSLGRCGVVGDERTGTVLLQKVNELALSLPEYKYIKLTDASTVELCDSVTVSLAHLKILTKGLSWYNSHGYFSENHESDHAHNSLFIASKISDTKVGSEPGFPPPVDSDETVQGYVSRLMESIGPAGTKCDEKQEQNAKILKKVVDLLSPSLKYNYLNLIKTVTRM